jgi:hypothetical protein
MLIGNPHLSKSPKEYSIFFKVEMNLPDGLYTIKDILHDEGLESESKE